MAVGYLMGKEKLPVISSDNYRYIYLAIESKSPKILSILIRGGNLDIFGEHRFLLDDICKHCDPDFIMEFISYKYKNKNKCIIEAAENGNLEFIKYLNTKFKINNYNNACDGKYVLAIAADKGNLLLVRYLVENGAKVNVCRNYALYLAAINGYLDIVKYLIKKGASVYEDCLCNCDNKVIYFGNYSNSILLIVKENIAIYLIEHGASIVDDPYLLFNAINMNKYELVKCLIRKGLNVDDCLYYASNLLHFDIIKYAITNGANININGSYPLFMACKHGDTQIVKFLISKGSKITNDCIEAAAANGHTTIIKYLLKKGFVVNDIYILLKCISKNLDVELLEYALSKGANINFNNGELLENACKNGKLTLVKSLLDHGASIKPKAIEAACKNNRVAILNYFVQRGLDVSSDNLLLRYAIYSYSYDVALYLIGKGNNKFSIAMANHVLTCGIHVNYDLIKYILDCNINISKFSYAAIDTAMRNNRLDIIKLYVDHGYKLTKRHFNRRYNNCSIEQKEYLSELYKIYKEETKVIS